MLSLDEVAELALAVCATAEAMGQTISSGGAQLIAEDLSVYSRAAIIAALKACRQEASGRFSLGMVLKQIQAADGRPGKDEAWSIALTASDEFDTVLLTPEIRQAMTASTPILQAGDKIGARMAFMSAYERHCIFARSEARPVTWEVSLGYDQTRRVAAIEAAVRARLITQESGIKHLADLRTTPITVDGQAIAGLITGHSSPHASEKTKAKLAEVRSILIASKAKKERELRKEAQLHRVNTYLRKRKVRVAIANLQEKH